MSPILTDSHGDEAKNQKSINKNGYSKKMSFSKLTILSIFSQRFQELVLG
jgi:hypothetical protein